MRVMMKPRTFLLRSVVSLGALVSLWCVPQRVAAQHDGVRIGTPFTGERRAELNLHAGFSPRGLGPAGGLRFAIPIIDNGFVRSINNAIYITFGADLFFEQCVGGCGKTANDYGVAFAVPVTGRWQFNFTPRWSAYGEVGPNLYVHTGWLGKGVFPGFGHVSDAWLAVAAGGKWHFSRTSSLTLAVGEPYTHVGIDISL